MKKISILSIVFITLLFGILSLSKKSRAQNISKVKAIIEEQNRNSIRWFNSGEIDSLTYCYAEKACFYRNGHPPFCGSEEINSCLQNASSGNLFKMTDIQIISLDVSGEIAVEKSLTTSRIQSGEIMKTINIQQWQKIAGKWLIVNDIDVAIK